MAGPSERDLFPDYASPDTVAVNGRCLVRTRDGHRVILVAGVVIAQYALGDALAETHAMVSLVEQGWADQVDVGRAFGRSPRSVRRYQRRFEEGGLAALGRPGGYPMGRPRLTRARGRLVGRLRAEGRSLRQIAERVGVSEKAIRKQLRQLGWRAPGPEQTELPLGLPPADPNLSGSVSSPIEPPPAEPAPAADPNLSGSAPLPVDDEPITFSADRDPADRSADRFLAYLGVLDDAAPLFRDGKGIPRAGVLLALPALAHSGVLDVAREVYGSIGPAFYGLRTTIVALLFMALLRIKRPEALKEHSPPDLGRLLGLDRAPEVKTLRRKLTRLAELGRAAEFGRKLAHLRVRDHGDVMGFLYLDGHVRAYHGKRTLPKAHLARMRIAMPATTDYWINDAVGDPLFVVTAEANAGLTKMLPPLCDEIRNLVGERRVTIVFDRGGWSPKLFQTLIGQGFDILTYRKGKSRPVPRRLFVEHTATFDRREVKYLLADQGIRLLSGALRLRQVTRLSDDHQTQIVTSRRDLSAVEVAYRMFERWRQENFFKYLREEYALDALADHRAVPADPTREVPNPVWNQLDARLRKARAEVISLSARYGIEALTNREGERPTMRGFKIANAKIARPVVEAFQRYAHLEAKRAKIPRRVPIDNVVDGEVVKLATERKHLTNVLKMVAHQAESDLVRRIAPLYRRAGDEGRTLIQSALASAGDIHVTETEIRVTLAPLSSAHRTAAVAALCAELDAIGLRFPGTRLRLRYAVAAAKADSSSGP
jgi:prepilin-type processing-associated H-X9-DG protein